MKEKELGQFDEAEMTANKTKNVEGIVGGLSQLGEMESEFDKFREIFVNGYGFSEQEFMSLCEYCLEGDIAEFLRDLRGAMEDYEIKKGEIMEAMKEIKVLNGNVFCSYVLIKRKAKMFKYKDVKRVIDRGHAWTYITDSLKGIELVGDFDDAIAALRLALKKGLFSRNEMVYTTKGLETTISDLGQALIDAGVTH